MKTEIDHDLTKQITNCLTEKSAEKKRNFIFVPGSKQSVLIVSKKSIGASKLKEAQKTADSSAHTKGVCFGQDEGGKTMVFLAKRPAAGLDRKLRQAIKENAGINCQVEVRNATDDELVEVDDKTTDTVRVPTKPTQQQRDIVNKALYKKTLALLGSRLLLLQQANPNQAATVRQKIGPLLERAEQLTSPSLPENQRQYKTALEVLVKLKGHIPAQTVNPNQPPTAVYDKHRADASTLLKQLGASAPRSALFQEVEILYASAGRHARLLQYDHAIPILESLLKSLPPVMARVKAAALVLHELSNQGDPEFSPVELAAHEEQYEAALSRPMSEVGQALGVHEGQMRQAIVERRRFLETAKAAQTLLQKAQTSLDGKAAGDLKNAFDTAYGKARQVNFNAGYDAMTQVEGQLRAALRMAEDKSKSSLSTPETQRVKFDMNVQNLRRALTTLATTKPDRAKQYGILLDKLVTVSAKNLEQAQPKLEETIALVTKDLQEVKDSTPREENRGWRRRAMKLGEREPENTDQSTQEWARRIEQNNVLTKVRFGREIASGGQGKVTFLEPLPGEDTPPLVIKTPLPGDAKGLQGLQEEMRLYQQVGDHPNLLKCLGMHNVDGQQGLILERVQGQQMNEYFQDLNGKLAGGEISPQEYWGTMQYTIRKTLGALAFLHDQGMSHNDIKPGNIMIDKKSGEVKVIDLGTLNVTGTSNRLVDTPLYKSPQNVKTDVSGAQNDAFAVGATAYASMNEKESFHYGDEQGLVGAGFIFQLEKIVQDYGQIESEEGAIMLEDKEHPAKDDPTRTAVKTQFTEFMNLLLHPDEAKRLSPKQALEHPFLRDSLLNDDQVKSLVKRLDQAPLEE